VNEKQVMAIVFFVDIRGFKDFCDRINKADEEFLPFWRDWQALIDEFEDEDNGYVKRIGDGIMVVKEIEAAPHKEISAMLNKLWKFLVKLLRLINKKMTPRPDGGRVRGGFGYVWQVPYKKDHGRDYVGSLINMIEKALRFRKELTFLLHVSAIERLPKAVNAKNGFSFQKIKCLHNGDEDEHVFCKSMFRFTKKT
jgi:hypothetical protein